MDELTVLPSVNESARITMNREFLVLKGKHIRIRDWYPERRDGNAVIPVQDILHMEYMKIRSKRLLMCFVFLAMIIFALCSLAFWARTKTRQLGRIPTGDEINFLEQLRQFGSDSCILLLLLAGFLAVAALICIGVYALRPLSLLRVSAKEHMLGVETRYYDRTQLQQIIEFWIQLK